MRRRLIPYFYKGKHDSGHMPAVVKKKNHVQKKVIRDHAYEKNYTEKQRSRSIDELTKQTN